VDPRALIVAAVLAVTLAACSTPELGRDRPVVAVPVEAAATVPAARSSQVTVQSVGGTGPEVLLPSQDSTDEEITTVAGVSIHRRHVYEHLLRTEPHALRKVIEQIEIDATIARAAEAFGIVVAPATIETMAQEDENELREVVARDLGPEIDFAAFLSRRYFRMTVAEYRSWKRNVLTQTLYGEYVVRYAALREDRVEARYIVHSDKSVLETVASKVRQGADFATLAIRHTEDANRMEGGLLPAISASFDHPVTRVAFQLEPGQLSDVFEREVDGVRRFYLVYCMRKIPGRNVPFAAVKDELDRDIEQRPMLPAEFNAAATQLMRHMESLKLAPEKR